MSKYTEAIKQYKHWYKRGFNHSDMPSSGILVTMGEALEIADRLEQVGKLGGNYCPLQPHKYGSRTEAFAEGYKQALKDIRGDE